jgi:hypothetical protein
MAKIGQSGALADVRADSTLDAITSATADPVNALGAIAAEEIAEREAIAADIEARAQADADAEMAELVDGWQTAMRHAADIVTSAADGLKPVWTHERMDAIGAALARCDAHYGWGGAGKLISHPLVAVGVASAPVVIGTVKWAQVEKAKAQAAQIEARRAMLAGAPAGKPNSNRPASGNTPNVEAGIDAHLAEA